MEIDFAAGHGVIAGLLKRLVVGFLIEGEIELVGGDVGVFVLAAGGEAGAAGGTEGGGAEDLVEAHAADGEGLDMGELDGDLGVAGEPVGAPLVRQEEEEVGLLRLGGSGEGGGAKEGPARGHPDRLLNFNPLALGGRVAGAHGSVSSDEVPRGTHGSALKEAGLK